MVRLSALRLPSVFVAEREKNQTKLGRASVARTNSFHLSPEGRGRAPELVGGSEGEGVLTLEFFSDARAPSPQPFPRRGESTRVHREGLNAA